MNSHIVEGTRYDELITTERLYKELLSGVIPGLQSEIKNLQLLHDQAVKNAMLRLDECSNLYDQTLVLNKTLPLIDDLIAKFLPLVHCLSQDASIIQKDAASSLKLAQTMMKTIENELRGIKER